MTRSRFASIGIYRFILYGVNVVLLVSMVLFMEWRHQEHEAVAGRMERYHLMTVANATAILGDIHVVEDALVTRVLKTGSPEATADNEPFLYSHPDAKASLYLAELELGKIVEGQNVFRGLEFKELVRRTERQLSDLDVIISGGLFQRSETETAQRQLKGLALSLEQLNRLHRSEHAELAKALPEQARRRFQVLIVIIASLLVISFGATQQVWKFVRRGTDELRKSEMRYRAVVEDQTELICRSLPDTTITFVNEAYCRCFGKSRDEFIG